jgi:hypothetical protein
MAFMEAHITNIVFSGALYPFASLMMKWFVDFLLMDFYFQSSVFWAD